MVRLLATKMTEKDDLAKRELERLPSSMEKMRDATKKLAKVITRAREETSQSTKLAERAIRTERLNLRVEALVGLLEESRRSTTITETLQKEAQRDMSNLGARVSENRDDINMLKARAAVTQSGVIGSGQGAGGLPPGRVGSEASKGQPAAPGLADDNASNLGYTPAPSHFGGAGYNQQDNARGRDESSEVPGSGGLFSAAMRAGHPERCHVCGTVHAPADLNKCPECRGNFCVRCSPGVGACPSCDGPAFRRGRDDQRAPIGQRPGGIGVARGENTRGMEKCEKIAIKDEPEANAIQMWIVDVATMARMAYGFDSNYAYAMVAGVMSHDEKTLDEPLKYNHLENALFVGLKGAIKTVALNSDVRVRMMDGKPLTALRLMKIMIEYFRVPEENEDMLHANALASVRLNASPYRAGPS